MMQIGPRSKNISKSLIGVSWHRVQSTRHFFVFVYTKALDIFVNKLNDEMHAHIPNFLKQVQKSNLPWLNEKCHEAIEAKHQAEGTAAYATVAACTSQNLQAERSNYTTKLKAQMEELPKGSKRWWALNKQLLNQ